MFKRWNDDKMDALDGKVDRIDRELRELRQELREDRRETKAGFEALHRTLIQTTVAVITGYVVGFAALVGLIATQL